MSHLNEHFHQHPRTDFSLVLFGSYAVGYLAGRVIGVLWTHGPSHEHGVRRLAGGAADVAHLPGPRQAHPVADRHAA